MADISKDCQIVELFSANVNRNSQATVQANELKDANEFIKELASNPTPNNRYEIAQILRYVVDNQLNYSLDYLDQIADVQRVGYGERATFQIDLPGIKAFWQAKASTTERSKVGHKYTSLTTDEVSVRPAINFYDLVTGRTDFTKVASEAAFKMELAIAQRVQQVLYDAFSGLTSPNYAQGNGIVGATIDPIIFAIGRYGAVSILGDIECITKFTGLTGFNGYVAQDYMKEANENGFLGRYKTANIVKMNNQYVPEDTTFATNVLRKDLLYVLPTGANKNLRPLKVVLEGEVQAMDATSINDKLYEVRMDKNVGVGIVAYRKMLGMYEDTSL